MAIAIRELSGFDRTAWNCRVESIPEGTINQTTHVDGFHMVTGGGFRPRYLVAEDEEGKVVGQLVLFQGPFAAQEVVSRPLLKPFRPLCDWAFSTYTWMQGPLVFAKERLAEIHSALVQYVDRRATRETFMVRQATLPPYEEAELQLQAGASMAGSGFNPQPRSTFLVDLRRTPEEMWKGLKSSARKNLRKMLDGEQLTVTQIQSPEDVCVYWEMLGETQRRNGRFVSYHTLEEFRERFWDEPHRLGVLQGMVVRTRDGIPVAGLLFRCFNHWLQELGVAYTEYSLAQKIYGQDFIKWHLMCWGHESGYWTYDLMGVEANSTDPKRRAIFQFKEKWGGVLVESSAYSKSYSPWRDAVVHLGARLVRWRRSAQAQQTG